ncbi:MAG: hypothetical protein KC561_06475 [Myxococcales bacterium]|nr:hypothetical protein [Myxococcales bacterium]
MRTSRTRPTATRRRLRRTLTGLTLVLLAGAATPVFAQDQGVIAVQMVDEGVFALENVEVFVEGVEDLVEQFGEFELRRQAEVESALSRIDREELRDCGSDTDCYADLLVPVGVDFILLVDVTDDGDEYHAELTGVDLLNREIAGFQEGQFPEPGQAPFLLVPTFEAIGPLAEVDVRRGRRSAARSGSGRTDPEPARRDPEPVVEEPVQVPTTPVPDDGGVNVLATVLTVSGGVLVAGGVAMWLAADTKQEDIQAAPHPRIELEALQSDGETFGTVGTILFSVGIASVITGVIFEIAGIGDPGSDDPMDFDDWGRLEFSPLPNRAGVNYRLEF